jgi:Zn-dependent oligopeptidase
MKAESGKAPVAKAEVKSFESIKQEIESKIQEKVHAKANPDGLRWDHTPAELKELAQSLIKKSNATINKILSIQEPRNFENTIKPIANLESDLEFNSQPIVFYSSVAVSKEMREASKEYEKELSAYNLELWMRDDLFNAFENYKKNA